MLTIDTSPTDVVYVGVGEIANETIKTSLSMFDEQNLRTLSHKKGIQRRASLPL